MSKAFTREEDGSEQEEIPSVRSPLPPGAKNYITPAGAERLEQRLKELLAKKQALIVREDGSSETEQRKVESAIRNLQEVLKSVVITGPPVDREKIAFGAAVTIRYESGEEEVFRIVGVDEADPQKGSVSWMSPLARALVSRKTGDKVKFKSPSGEEELTVVSVRYGDD
jgi:transcription elongation factor GreB